MLLLAAAALAAGVGCEKIADLAKRDLPAIDAAEAPSVCTTNIDCHDDDECNGQEWCNMETSRCMAGTPEPDGMQCAGVPRRICLEMTCVPSVCGDGFTDTVLGEECDGPAVPGCTTSCGSAGTGTCEACRVTCEAPAETCNGADDDCDGTADEDFPCVQFESVYCTTFCGTSGVGACTTSCTFPDSSACIPPPGSCCTGADCGSCTGTPLPCAEVDAASCESQTGCTLDPGGPCGGTDPACTTIFDMDQCIVCGCWWTVFEECDVNYLSDCSSITNEASCTACGCTWASPPFCTGTHGACESRSSAAACDIERWCSWTAGTCNDFVCQ